MTNRLGELLIKEKLISPDQLQKAMEAQKSAGGRLGANLTKLGFIKESELTSFISKKFGVPAINLDEFEISPEVIGLVTKEVCVKHTIIPVNRAGSTLIVATADPSNIFAIDDIKFLTGYNVETAVASEESIKKAIEKYHNVQADTDMGAEMSGIMDELEVVGDEEEVDVSDLEKGATDAPVVRLVNMILTDAIKKNASDIHVEPYEKMFRVRFRIDGVMSEIMKPPLKLKNAMTSRLKIMSNLDIAERRLPQDGRIKLKMSGGKEMDFRVSVLPTLFGEKVVLRLLDKSNLQLDMTKLGFEEKALKDFKWAIGQPYGMVLVTGPTGSGKTTTLYSALSELNKVTENVSTAEDPVEFNLPGINQVQMHEDIGLNFAAALRSFLRQDPDIIMVGEIRDFETAEIGVKAALTGHLVLSTLHTNDAPSTINRLLNMGIEPFLVTASVNLIVAQRLARKICQECKAPIEVAKSGLVDVGVPPDQVDGFVPYEGKGCDKCNNGYKGRIALYEVMIITEELKELILSGSSTTELKREAMRQGMKTLRQSGLSKVKEGVSSLKEVTRVTAQDR